MDNHVTCSILLDSPFLRNFDAYCPFPLKQNFCDQHVVFCCQILSLERWSEVGGGGAPPHALVHGGVHVTHPLLLVTIEVLTQRVAWSEDRS